MPDILQIVVATIAMFVGSIIAGTAGFGMGMTASPFMLLVLDPRTVVVISNAMGIAVFTVVLYQSRRALPVKEMSVIAVVGLVGTPVGVFALSTVSTNLLRIGILVLIMFTAIAVVSNAGTIFGKSKTIGPVVGFVVGAIIAAFGIGGPLMVLYLLARGWSSQMLRASMSFFFLINMFTGVVGYVVTGLYTKERVVLTLIVAVPVLIGFSLGGLLLKKLDENTFRQGVIAVILFTSTMTLAWELFHLAS
ncbi:MAG: sulfite exporter TauE/SafE family protein [SAR202 cluster bacterium]|nr:sulfite exporter TauE/SafE family protein [SAR202 cluster bacterium]